jgi:hypothetical protein
VVKGKDYDIEEFTPDERSSMDEISAGSQKIKKHVREDETLKTVFDSVFDMILIVDSNFQAVHASRTFLNFFQLESEAPILGLRPGEIFRCVHAKERDTGCGTTEYCDRCGVLNVGKAALKGKRTAQEVEISTEKNGIYSFRISASRLILEDELFVFYVIRDISDKKRRESLERIFFHDVLDMSTIIWGYAALLKEGHAEKSQELGSKIFMATRRLIDEIQYQRSLIRAEQKELPLLVQEVNSLEVIKEAAEHYRYHRVASNKVIHIDERAEEIVLTSDFSLLQRVLGNLIKNALEAVEDGGVVTVGCKRIKKEIEFWVHNPTFISDDVQRQIFARSVSTKGRGRGLGTYSVKYITEHYLKGHASFESSKEKGTTFTVRYPVKADFKPQDKSLDLGGITPQE